MDYVEGIRNLEQLERWLDYLRRWNPMYWMMALVGIHTGLRISDILRLTAGHVRGTHLVMRAKKTGKTVRILISDHLRRELDRYIANLDDKDHLFCSRQGWNKPITRSRAYQILNEAARAVGLQHVGTHSLRKTFGWFLYKETGNVALLQELFGHDDPADTLRYIGVIDSDADEIMKHFSIGK